ncbi:MAG TPA: cytochrome c oxidase assembly protein, partial [Thermomicrobiales bacterium]|nr:cytochrome c oxidase assembly protein [Thermomicrobiales bacterium]
MALPPASHLHTHARAIRALRGCAIAWLALAAATGVAQAHTTDAVAPDRLLDAWKADPWVLIAALVAGWLYARGIGHLNEMGTRTGRGPLVGPARIAAFSAGLLTLVLALSSPLDTATATIFSAHMIQHVLLVAVAPPLILLGLPTTVFLNGVPRGWRRPLATLPHRIPGLAVLLGVLTMPAVAWLVHAGTLWAWHIPWLYDAAVQNERLHAVEHATFVITALLYWWTIVPAGAHTRNALGPAMGILSVFAMGMQSAALGIILTFWSTPIYPVYVGRSELWHISALSDQRLAGLIMWIPAGSVYVV